MTTTTDAPTPRAPLPHDGEPGDPGPPADRILTAVTAAAVVVGVVLRFLPRSGMWLDEALTANISGLPLGDIPDALRHDGHPPLFYVLLHVWSSIGGDSDWWLRALPGVFSTLTLPVAYLVGRRLGSRTADSPDEALGGHRTGLIALAIMAVLPFGIRFGAEVRMYSLVMLLVGVGYLLVDDLLRARRSILGGTVPTAAATAIVAAALLWSHYWAMWLLGAVGLLALWRVWRERASDRRTGARALVAGLVVGGALYLPWVPTMLYQSAHTGTPWGELYGPASVAVITTVDFAGAEFGIAQLLSYLLVLLIVLAAIALVDGRQRIVLGGSVRPRVRSELVVIALTMGAGWATAYASGNTFASRYASVVYPLFVLCVAAGIAVVRHRRTAAALLAAVVAASIWGGVSTVNFERSQTDRVVERIRDDIDAHDVAAPVVISCPDQLGVATQRQVDHLLADPVEVIPYPTGGDPRFVDWVDYGDRNAAASAGEFLARVGDRIPAGSTVYLVANFSYRTFEGQCESLLNHLAASRDTSQLVERDPDRHDEGANLWVLRPRA